MKILFAGTPELAVPSLEALSAAYPVVGVLTNPDQPEGRGRGLIPPPVKRAAEALGLRVFQPERLDHAFIRAVGELSPDLLVAVAYGRIFRENFLSLFPRGGINLHPSLLPRHRGCSPLQAAILAGDRETGVTIQRLALQMDAGEILAVRVLPLEGTETAGSLGEWAGREGAELLLQTVRELEKGPVKGIAQDEGGVSFCYRINKQDGLINWEDSAVLLERKVRAYHPWPGAWTTWKGKRLIILQASLVSEDPAPGNRTTAGEVLGVDKRHGFLVQTGNGVLGIGMLQLQAKKALDWKSFLNGNTDFPGSILGSDT